MYTKRILILSPFYKPNIGGVETHISDLVSFLTGHNYFVYLLTYQPLTTKATGLSIEKAKNLFIRRFSWFGFNWFNLLEPYPILEFLYLFPGLFFGTLIFYLRNHRKIDAIHAHGFIASLITRIITLIYPKKTTMSVHAIYEFRKKGLMAVLANWILQGFDTIMPLAEESKKDLLAAGVAENKIKNYAQWVDQKNFKPRNKLLCRERLKISGKFIVLFIGRMIEKKGPLFLAKVAKKIPEAKFIFVGDGPVFSSLKQMAKETPNMDVVGKKTQIEAADYFGAADVVVVPSLYEEGFARVVLETLSSGRPIIASNLGCLPEMITRDIGIIIKPTEKNMIESIHELIKNKKRLKEMTKNARIYAVKHFSEKNAFTIASTY